MTLFVSSIILITLSGVPGLFCRREGNGGEGLACLLSLTGCAAGLAAVILAVLAGGDGGSLTWSVPGGNLKIAIDALSASFLLPLFLVTGAGSVYGLKYWPQAENPDNGRKLRLFYGLIGGAMILLLSARNGVLFLMGWEVMALAGFFLITTEEHKQDVRRAGYIYLIATHTGTLALFGMFALIGLKTGSLDYPAVASLSALGSGALFLLGLFGFGMKSGLMPLHIWLPGAHAAAPSHASAVLSGVMIKTGIYGLVRVTSFFAVIPPWWGWSILTLGVVSGIMGVALALAQHDIKRLLAYHSVENIGIILLGLGLALLGRSYHAPELIALGLAGCLLHVANHGLFKSILFMSAGSVIHAVGSRDIDHYGGLLKRQPWTGLLFLGGAVAICGLPPFNGFISEWLIYLGSFQPLTREHSVLGLAVLAAPALALIGALAVACFVKVFGVTFLGEPRSAAADHAHEAPASMSLSTALLLLACAWIGLLPTTLVPLLRAAIGNWTGGKVASAQLSLAPLPWVSGSAWLLLLLSLLVFAGLSKRAGKSPRTISTWGCGFSLPSARMQYTASSFGDFLVRLFNFGLFSKRHGGKVKGLFPTDTRFSSHTPDAVLENLLEPVFSGAAWCCHKLRAGVQNGSIALYLLYVVLTVLGLLALVTR